MALNVPVAIRTSRRVRQEDGELLVAPSLERRRLQCYLGQIIADCLAVVFAFGSLGYLYLGIDGLGDALIGGQVLLPVFLTIALL